MYKLPSKPVIAFGVIIIFGIIGMQHSSAQPSRRYIRTDYTYDIVSDKVNQISLQTGRSDQFFHRYEYDSENRVTHVYTSPDNLVWRLEAKYFYYAHGSLMRVELGQGVQGVDYAYTVHGWIKGVNTNTLQSRRDIGKDGENGLHKHFAKDELGFSLGYFNGDYSGVNIATGDSFAAATSNADLAGRNLYNGNISHMVTAIGKFMGNGSSPQGMSYTYDQLNRIRSAVQHIDPSVTATNAWSSGTATDDYREEYSYDANGNIMTMTRNAYGENKAMDQFAYVYENKLNGYARNTNKLRQVTDAAGANEWEDIESQQVDNYVYDEIGNLIKDNSEGITSITWTASGKVKQITKSDGQVTSYAYDPQGNRISKRVQIAAEDKTTHYVRDASGSVISIYQKDITGLTLLERPLLGIDRLGVRSETHSINDDLAVTQQYHYFTGKVNYELKNHLGNVLAVVSDGVEAAEDDQVPGTIGVYTADVVSANEYSSFGAKKPGLSFNSKNYRYGFNGKEKLDDGELGLNHYDYGFRIYNPNIGRFLSTDPLTDSYAMLTPYQFASNTPIWAIDLDGLEGYKYTKTIDDPAKGKIQVTVVHLDILVLTGSGLVGDDYRSTYTKDDIKSIQDALKSEFPDNTYVDKAVDNRPVIFEFDVTLVEYNKSDPDFYEKNQKGKLVTKSADDREKILNGKIQAEKAKKTHFLSSTTAAPVPLVEQTVADIGDRGRNENGVIKVGSDSDAGLYKTLGHEVAHTLLFYFKGNPKIDRKTGQQKINKKGVPVFVNTDDHSFGGLLNSTDLGKLTQQTVDAILRDTPEKK